MSIVPIRGRHESIQSLLGEIMEDEEANHIAVIVMTKDGSMRFAHFEMSRQEMAYASVILAKESIS